LHFSETTPLAMRCILCILWQTDYWQANRLNASSLSPENSFP
jgi:hypothetical protein